MKIIRSSEEAKRIIEDKAKANIGCDACPCCGSDDYSISESFRVKGFLKLKFWRADVYVCNKCFSKWKSEPYRI